MHIFLSAIPIFFSKVHVFVTYLCRFSFVLDCSILMKIGRNENIDKYIYNQMIRKHTNLELT